MSKRWRTGARAMRGKLAIACRLRKETTVTLAWIAKRLQILA
jgi:hypothetical protein